MNRFKEGDVVALNSGGAPLTVTDTRREDVLQVTCLSVGGVMQQFNVPRAALALYTGPRTPAVKGLS